MLTITVSNNHFNLRCTQRSGAKLNYKYLKKAAGHTLIPLLYISCFEIYTLTFNNTVTLDMHFNMNTYMNLPENEGYLLMKEKKRTVSESLVY